MDLKNKNAIVTGASRGIGACVARTLGSLGANVLLTYLGHEEEARAVVEELEAEGVRAAAMRADAADFERAAGVVEHALETFGGLDILVCNAGTTSDHVVWKMSENEWDRVLGVNLKGSFNYARAAAPWFRERRYGKIVNITSINGLRGKAGQANYAASKGGIIALTRSLARELGVKNINVNAVAPGLIETAMTDGMSDEAKNRALGEIALGRIGNPQDVAGAVAFLVSDLARHITGQVINVDGGQHMA